MSGGTLDRLVYMANQIAREFGNQRPREAIEATWDHLWHFWDPRMRSMIVAHLAEGGEGLSDVAKGAVAKFATAVEPESRTQATEYDDTGGDDAETMSDAG